MTDKIKSQPAATSFGLTFNQLQVVFPFHLRIDSNFIITQVGSSLGKLFPSNKNTNEPICIGQRIDDIFSVSSPIRFQWNYKLLKVYENTNFSFDVKDATMLCTNQRLPLVGGIILSDPNSNSECSEAGAIFLLNLRIYQATELLNFNFKFNHLNRFGFQKDLIFANIHWRTELIMGSKSEQIKKSLEQERLKTTAMLKTKSYFVRHVSHEIRTPLNIVVTGLKYFKEIIAPWYEKKIAIQYQLQRELDDRVTQNSNVISRVSIENSPDVSYFSLSPKDTSGKSTVSTTPLSSGSISSGDPEMDEIENALADMMQASSVAVDILNDLLLYEKIEANLMDLEFAEVNTRVEIFKIIHLFKLQAMSKEIKVSLDLDSVSNIYINADIGKFSQVIRNLMSNALKFTPAGGSVHVSADILVNDDGTDTFVPLSEASDEAKEEALKKVLHEVCHGKLSLSTMSRNHIIDGSKDCLSSSRFTEISSRIDTSMSCVEKSLEKLKTDSDKNNKTSSIDQETNKFVPTPPLSNKLLSPTTFLQNARKLSNITLQSCSSPTTAIQSIHEQPLKLNSNLYRNKDDTNSNIIDERVSSQILLTKATLGSDASLYVGNNITNSGEREQRKYKIRISIKDTGRGISLNDQQNLFQEFMQVSANKTQNGGGSGLGLWVSRKIIEAHSGSIHVYSEGEIGKGSTFYLDIPIATIKEKPVPLQKEMLYLSKHNSLNEINSQSDTVSQLSDQIKADVSMIMASVDFNGNNSGGTCLKIDKTNTAIKPCQAKKLDITMLIVDDSAINRKMTKRLFTSKCTRIDEAVHGKDGLNKVAEFNTVNNKVYDVIMMDFVMPQMNGPDCVRELRKQGYQGLIIGVTGNSQDGDIELFNEAGVNKVMTKPLDSEKFMNYIIDWPKQTKIMFNQQE